MKIAGIIAEYNPFHNGHAWHVKETRRLTGCDYVVACMDGHFTQRGEPTPFSKWSRARMALNSGVDAVFELPALWAVCPADAFARGGVAILGGLGVDALSFGCEIDNVETLEAMADIAIKEPTSVSKMIQAGLSRGESHARARGNAIADYLNLPREAVNAPNLILGVEYIRSSREQGFSILPVPILRRGDYHDATLDPFASASAIRAAIARGEAVEHCLPTEALPFAEPERLHAMDDLLLWRLRQMSLDEMANLPEAGEGIEHRLYRLCRESGSREALLNALKCKRYTYARLSRMLTHALLGFDRETLAAHPLPVCARLLGMRNDAAPLLKELKRRTTIPIAASINQLADDFAFQFECRVTDLWALLHDAPERRGAGRELREKFVKV